MNKVLPLLLLLLSGAFHCAAAEDEQPTLTLSDGDRAIATYNAAYVPSPIDDAPWYGRSGFIHPVYSPKGRAVTAAFPEDHPHQHGLMFAWTSSAYEGQKVDFWNSQKKQAIIEHVETVQADDDSITVKLRHTITAGKHQGTSVLNETWTITRVPHETLHVFDLVSVQRCATDKPLTIHQYKYGGMCVRGPARWSTGDAMLTSEGKNQVEGNHTRPGWVALFGEANTPGEDDAQTAGIAAMAHPDNLHSPQPVRLHPEMSYFCFAPMVADTFQIKPGEPYVSRFRFAAYDGKPDAKQLDALMQAFVKAKPETKPEPAPKPVTGLRIDGPEVMNHGVNLVSVRVQREGSKRWREAKPEAYELSIVGDAGRIEPDVSQQPVNPATVLTIAGRGASITVRATAGEVVVDKTFPLEKLKATDTLTLTIDPADQGHAYGGLGAGLMFYDNQMTIGKELLDWCFKDVKTSILHVLIRPDYEPINDNDDWQTLNDDAFDWSKSDRLFWLAWNAKQRNPDLKVYACLYSPPKWMKANDDTAGDAGLKEGERYELEMAEYVYAFLKRAAWKGTKIDYLCLFNEPDFPHSQDGTYYDSLAKLAKAQAFISAKINELIDADEDFHHKPQYIFPETLGPGSITRAGEQSKALAKLAEDGLLDHLHAWGVHDYWNTGGNYWDNRYNELRAFPGVGDRPIWMTEWAQRFPRGDLASSMEYGQKILNALRLGASTWMAFEWAHPAQNQSGLISTQWGEGFPKKRYWRSKSYYAFKQVANTSPIDGRVVAIDAKLNDNNRPSRSYECLAIRKGDQLVVHLINTRNRPVRYAVALPDDVKARLVSARVTGPNTNDAELANPSSKGELAPYTLLTLVYELKQ